MHDGLHPTNQGGQGSIPSLWAGALDYHLLSIKLKSRDVAQSGSAGGPEPSGCTFESCHPDYGEKSPLQGGARLT